MGTPGPRLTAPIAAIGLVRIPIDWRSGQKR